MLHPTSPVPGARSLHAPVTHSPTMTHHTNPTDPGTAPDRIRPEGCR
jgi:hypothetical protein